MQPPGQPPTGSGYPPVPNWAAVPANLPDQTQEPAVYQTEKPTGGAPGPYPSGPPGYYTGPWQQQQQPQVPHGGSPYPEQRPPEHYGVPMPPAGYPQQQQQQQYGPGMHVMGYPVMLQDDGSMSEEERTRERGGVLLGTCTLIFGFCLPFLWVGGSLLPCCFPRSARVRSLACANSLAFIITTLLVVILPIMFVGRRGL